MDNTEEYEIARAIEDSILNEQLTYKSDEVAGDNEFISPSEKAHDSVMADQPIVCPNCKRDLPNDSKYCLYCGTKIRDASDYPEQELLIAPSDKDALLGSTEKEPTSESDSSGCLAAFIIGLIGLTLFGMIIVLLLG